jgi:hypothetical protein
MAEDTEPSQSGSSEAFFDSADHLTYRVDANGVRERPSKVADRLVRSSRIDAIDVHEAFPWLTGVMIVQGWGPEREAVLHPRTSASPEHAGDRIGPAQPQLDRAVARRRGTGDPQALALALSPFGVILLPAVAGGLVVAAVLKWRRPRARPTPTRDVFGKHAVSTDIINMAHIKVAGLGGLGFVAVAIVTAVTVPRIGEVMAIAAIGGGLIALVIIVWRRVHGPLHSTGSTPGAHKLL